MLQRGLEADVVNRGTRGRDVDDLRRHNLSAVLGLVHRNGPLSRAGVTGRTGLNRSTVGYLVAELSERGLITEAPPGPAAGAGRPSPIVSPRGDVAAGVVNVEADAITVALLGLDGVVAARARHDTTETGDAAAVAHEAAGMLHGLMDGLPRTWRVVGVGAAVPGLVREADGVVRNAPGLGWRDEPFGTLLQGACGLPVDVANDANLGAGAEQLFGAGRDAEDLIYLNSGSSGIGSGVIVGGVPLTGHAGYAGEIGHTTVNTAGARCRCGAVGCLETEVGQDRMMAAMRASAGNPDGARSAEAWRQLGCVALALKNVANILNPRRIVLGGFLRDLDAAAPGLLEALMRGSTFTAVTEDLDIVAAGLGDDAILVGAAERAFRRLLEDPSATLTCFGCVLSHPASDPCPSCG